MIGRELRHLFLPEFLHPSNFKVNPSHIHLSSMGKYMWTSLHCQSSSSHSRTSPHLIVLLFLHTIVMKNSFPLSPLACRILLLTLCELIMMNCLNSWYIGGQGSTWAHLQLFKVEVGPPLFHFPFLLLLLPNL